MSQSSQISDNLDLFTASEIAHVNTVATNPLTASEIQIQQFNNDYDYGDHFGEDFDPDVSPYISPTDDTVDELPDYDSPTSSNNQYSENLHNINTGIIRSACDELETIINDLKQLDQQNVSVQNKYKFIASYDTCVKKYKELAATLNEQVIDEDMYNTNSYYLIDTPTVKMRVNEISSICEKINSKLAPIVNAVNAHSIGAPDSVDEECYQKLLKMTESINFDEDPIENLLCNNECAQHEAYIERQRLAERFYRYKKDQLDRLDDRTGRTAGFDPTDRMADPRHNTLTDRSINWTIGNVPRFGRNHNMPFGSVNHNSPNNLDNGMIGLGMIDPGLTVSDDSIWDRLRDSPDNQYTEFNDQYTRPDYPDRDNKPGV